LRGVREVRRRVLKFIERLERSMPSPPNEDKRSCAFSCRLIYPLKAARSEIFLIFAHKINKKLYNHFFTPPPFNGRFPQSSLLFAQTQHRRIPRTLATTSFSLFLLLVINVSLPPNRNRYSRFFPAYSTVVVFSYHTLHRT